MNEPTRHIVYHSRMDAAADEFWWELMMAHPTATLVILASIGAAIVGGVLWSWFRSSRR